MIKKRICIVMIVGGIGRNERCCEASFLCEYLKLKIDMLI